MKKEYLKKYNNTFYLSDDLDGAPIKIGTRVIKINSEAGDNVPNGMGGKVIGSLSQPVRPPKQESNYLYAVIWDDKDVVVGVVGKKLKIDKFAN